MAASSVPQNRTANPTNVYTAIVLAATTINETYLWFYLVFAGVCFIIGFVGNLLIVVVMLQRKLWRRSYSRVFVQLAVCDTLVLITCSMKYINVVSYTFHGKIALKPSTRIQCICFEYFITICVSASPWTLVLVAAERMCVVCFPFRGPRFWSPKTASRLCLFVACSIALINSYLLVTIDVSDSGCNFKDQQFTKPLLTSILTSVGPFIALAITSVITSVALYRKKGDSKTTRASKYSNQVTVLVLLLCVFFLATTFPATLFAPFVWTNSRLKNIFAALIDILMINYSYNLCVYLLTGKEIRNELRKLMLKVFVNGLNMFPCRNRGGSM
ncbi:uncharacterized protein LOC141912225 [Tubulanus polymorphus]|uniref:uncharacterized protein LOC141912225 n=1 Tax=Tubulanus polymorphus TaxID=672921 RepID=UPI003DA527E6